MQTVIDSQDSPFHAGSSHFMAGQNVICFAKEWDEDPTSNNHVMLEIAKRNRVLWLNSVATRTPRIGQKRDLQRIWRKLGLSFRGPVEVQPGLWTYTPLVLPFPHNPYAVAVNRLLLRGTITTVRRRLGMHRFQLWSFLPNVVDYVDGLGASTVVYYCVDEWSGFTHLDGPRIASLEERLCRRADIVFAASSKLVARKLPFNPKTYLAAHGVDYDLFRQALDPGTPVPDDIAKLAPPIIGFYGTLDDWIDFGLIEHLAKSRPDWNFVLIGKPIVDTRRLELPNVHLLGRRPHSQLPNYCRAFTVGIIPYLITDRMQYVNPIKLREYLSAGVPVVSTPVPEVLHYATHCAIANGGVEFERCIARAIEEDSLERRSARSAAMRLETWEHKVHLVTDRVMELQGEVR
jgi:glycosyltransferase involved in cell wall biosynthesis